MDESVAAAARAFRDGRVGSVLRRLRPVLGARWAVIGDPGAAQPGLRACVVPSWAAAVAGAAPTAVGRAVTVVGAPDAVPLLSGALTGVLLARVPTGAGDAAVVLEEAARLLQPGGFVLLIEPVRSAGTRPGGRTLEEIVELLRGAGLEPGRRAVCHVTPSPAAGWAARLPRRLWGVAAAVERLALRLRLIQAEEVTAVLAARRPGGLDVEYPDARRMVGGMLLPPRWLERS